MSIKHSARLRLLERGTFSYIKHTIVRLAEPSAGDEDFTVWETLIPAPNFGVSQHGVDVEILH